MAFGAQADGCTCDPVQGTMSSTVDSRTASGSICGRVRSNARSNHGMPRVTCFTFDPQVLGGKAVILRVDCSAVLLPIESDGRILIDGKNIFDPAQPFWDGKVPPIKWPE